MPAIDQRAHHVTKIPISGWAVTSLPVPEPPLGTLSGPARRFWENSFSAPASILWGPSELVLLERLSNFYAEFIESGDTRQHSEMRQLEAQLGLTIKSRRDLKLQIVSDADFIEDLQVQGAERSFAMVPLDVITGLSIDELTSKGEEESDAERRAKRFGKVSE